MENKKNILMISGALTSGKGILASLLEGHPNVFAIPQWHDMFADTLLKFSLRLKTLDPNWRGKDDRILYMRKFLSETDYPILEQYAIQKQIPFPVSGDDVIQSYFDFDFYKHDRQFFHELYELEDVFNLNKIAQIFYKSFISNWNQCPIKYENVKYFVSASEPGFNKYDDLFSKMPNAKVIYIKRDFMEWFFSNVYRWEKIYKANTFEEKIDWCFFEDPRIKGLIYMDKSYKLFAEKYPINFKVINFNDLIENNKEVMQEVTKFLDIPMNEILIYPTFLGQKFENKNINIVGKVIDNSEKLNISKKDQRYVMKLYENFEEIVLNIKPQKTDPVLELSKINIVKQKVLNKIKNDIKRKLKR